MKDITKDPTSDPEPPFAQRMANFELMYHWSTSTCETLAENATLRQFWQRNVVRIGLRCDFVMRSLLSLAALHLAYLNPARRPELIERSILHQSEAARAARQSIETAGSADGQEVGENLFVFSVLTVYHGKFVAEHSI